MKYLRIKNWHEFQHYKDRNPPWIKLHCSLLNDYEFGRLQDACKAHLILIWLFASTQKDGLVPADPVFLKKKLGLQREPDLKLFINHGLLIPEQSASKALADCKQDASNVLALARSREAETEAYKATEESKGGSAAAPPSADSSPVVEKLPLRDGQEFEVRQSLVAQLEPLYPRVDVPATLKEMRGWLLLNESRRKTRAGVKAFIGRWLQTEQEKHGG